MRLPGRALLLTDTFFKSLIGLMEVGVMAYRLGKANGLASSDLEQFIATQSAMPGSASWRAAAELAEKYTFTNSLKSTKEGGGFIEGGVKKLSETSKIWWRKPSRTSW